MMHINWYSIINKIKSTLVNILMLLLFKLVANAETMILKDDKVLIFCWYKLPETIKNDKLVEDKLEDFTF
jgi:hypothetical protein